MPPIGRGGFAQLLAPTFRKVYFETGKDRPLEYPLIFNVDEMPWNPFSDLQAAGLGTMPTKNEGSQFTLDEPIMGGTKEYEATPYGLGIEITYEMWRDDLYGLMNELIAELKRASINRQEVNAWSNLNNAFDATVVGFTAAESLCATSHTRFGDGGTYANRPSPDVGFSVSYLQGAILRYETMVNERGLPRLMAPTMIVIGPSNKMAAREILGSGGVPYKGDNEINALIEEDFSYLVSHYLTTSTYHFCLAAKGVHDLNFFWRDRPIFDAFDDPRTKNAVFTSYQRHAHGYGSPRGADGSTG